ncbi:transporter associated domain-containing protein [Celeribacter litoreus]|uniref:transporter associated domain-containing protein n=1 Tax=Celeribacter litoreus TaxID=2876714 RepID=UPI001CCD777A|nr:transporter associated domain-containing protein [Celeribacter litoreus]MCA0044177.1 CBS domain-containing protein [Celeribacter litoreus]
MGDTEPGSSTAAQSAPSDPTKSGESHENHNGRNSGGWFSRLFSSFSNTPESSNEPTGPSGPTIVDPPAPVRPGMVNLRRMRVEDVAIPKAEIVAVPTDIKKEDLVQVFRESGMTRLPVYKGTMDSPVGLVHLKDFALEHGFNGKGERFNLKKMLRPLIYAPPSMPIGVLLQKMQSERMHMALVIDEYGGVDGLVTLEDCVEQVIGEIEDEHDIEEDLFWTQTAPGILVAQAKAPLDEFETAIGMRLADEEDDEEIDTLGGLVFLMTGRVPARGEVIEHPSGAQFEIVDADPRRIKRIRVRLPHAVTAKADA